MRTPAADAASAPWGPPYLPARRIPGSDLSERPACTSQGRFRGGAPARPVCRSPCPGCTARIANPLPDKALARHRMFRGKANRVSLAHRRCFGAAFSPKQRPRSVAPVRPQPARRGRGRLDSANGSCGGGANGRLVPARAALPVAAAGSRADPRHDRIAQPRRMPAVAGLVVPGTAGDRGNPRSTDAVAVAPATPSSGIACSGWTPLNAVWPVCRRAATVAPKSTGRRASAKRSCEFCKSGSSRPGRSRLAISRLTAARHR